MNELINALGNINLQEIELSEWMEMIEWLTPVLYKIDKSNGRNVEHIIYKLINELSKQEDDTFDKTLLSILHSTCMNMSDISIIRSDYCSVNITGDIPDKVLKLIKCGVVSNDIN